MSITIKQIAELAGVSRATVDKVLHNRPGISDEVREKIKQIAEDYHYVPNQFARALSNAEKQLVFAIIIPNPSRAIFFDMLKKGMEAAASSLSLYGVRLEFYYTDGISIDEIKPILSYLERQEIQGIAIRFQDDDLIKQTIDHFAKKGIPVITFDTDIPNSKRICFIGEDNYKSGRMAAVLLSKCTSGKGKVAMITGSNQVLAHRLRAKGFSDVIAESYPDMIALPPIETYEQDVIEYQETKKLLKEHSDIRGIFIVAGRLKETTRAIEDSHLDKKINIVVCDYAQESTPYIMDGIVDFAIGLAPYKEGHLVIRTLFDVIYNKKSIDTFIKTPTSVYINENIKDSNI